MQKTIAVYFMTNKKDGTLYVGSTNDLHRRIEEHKSLKADGFTKRYTLIDCVHFEICETVEQALRLERRYKKYNRQWKIDLIEKLNPDWQDLSYRLNELL